MIQINTSLMNKDIKKILDSSKQLRSTVLGESTMMGVASQAVTIIKLRTAQGVDADGTNFKPYTESYRDWKVKKGGSSRPDLRGIGSNPRMMENIHAQFVEAGRALLLFLDTEQANKAQGNYNKREFFDIRQPRDISALASYLDRTVTGLIRGLGL